jgi:hypothetical protein
MFYYGKRFTSKKQKLSKEGELEEEDYQPLSVTKPGAEPEDVLEQVASKQENKDNRGSKSDEIMALLQQLLGSGGSAASEKELRDILSKGA